MSILGSEIQFWYVSYLLLVRFRLLCYPSTLSPRRRGKKKQKMIFRRALSVKGGFTYYQFFLLLPMSILRIWSNSYLEAKRPELWPHKGQYVYQCWTWNSKIKITSNPYYRRLGKKLTKPEPSFSDAKYNAFLFCIT